MESQISTECLPSQQLAIIPLQQNIHPQNTAILTVQHTSTDEETGQAHSTSNNLSSFHRIFFSKLIDEFQEHYTTEKLLTTIFIWVMGTISSFHLILAIELLEKTALSNSISTIVMSFFKYSLAIITRYSLLQIDNKPRLLKISVLSKRHISCLGLALSLVQFLAPINEKQRKIMSYIINISCLSFLGDFNRHKMHRFLINFCLSLLLHTMVFPIIARVSFSSDYVLALWIINASFHAVSSELENSPSMATSVLCFTDDSIKKLLPLAVARVNNFVRIFKQKKLWKLVKYAVGLVGTVLFQNFFRLTSLDEVKAFLYVATSWLAGRTCSHASEDFGILNFLLGNMILGSTVSQSGLGSTTWFTCGVCLLLYVLHISFKSVTSPNVETMRRPPFFFWIFYLCTILESFYCLYNQI